MGKQFPEEIVSKYNDVDKYEYNATTNPGPLAEGKNPPINNFYSGIFVRMGDKINPYGNWYTKVSKNLEVQARIDLAIKKGPFTESYPEYGQGGELQMVPIEEMIIKYDRLDLLPNPRTDIILKEVK